MSVEREKPRQDKAAIVDLSARQKPTSPTELHGHLKLCLKSTLSRLEPALARLFENVDDALFDLAEKADSNALQTNYFDGMRHVRKKRQDCERIFRESIHNRFSRFAHGRLQAPTTGNAGNDDGGELSLVGDQELEESLAIAGIVSKIESHSAREMYGLNERFSLLAGGQKVDDGLNPVGAAHITDAFHKAADELSVELPVKLIIYKLFDKYVASQLPGLYQQLNKQLSDAGVLPNLKPTVPGAGRRGPAYSAPMPGAMAGETETPTESDYGESYADQAGAEQVAPVEGSHHGTGPAMAPPPDARIFHGLRKLLAGYRGTTPPPPLQTSASAQAQPGPTTGAPAGSGGYTDLMNALSILQGELLEAQDEAAAQAQPSGPISKARILTQMRKLGGAPARVGGDAEDTIDLVSMLFDFILKDKNLAPQIQAVLSRLQLPYVKVALLDRQMFAQKSHPARKLLDELAHAGIGWSAETDQDNRLLRKIEGIVERLLTEFDDDISVFSDALDEFRDFMSKMERRAKAAERRTAEASKGREKLLTARKRAAKEVLGRLKDREVPPLIHDILTRPWANVLVLIYLRQGDESEQWQKALDTADLLLWSGEPKSTDEDQRRLIDIRADLEQDLRQGLELVAYHETDIQEIIKRLDKCHIGLLEAGRDAKPAEAAKPAPDVGEFKMPTEDDQAITEPTDASATKQTENEGVTAEQGGSEQPDEELSEAAEQLSQAKEEIAAAVSELAAEIEEVSDQLSDQEEQALPEPKHSPMSGFVEEIVMESGDTSDGAETALEEDEFVELARSLEVGAWLEFTEDDGTVLRAKLSWISPISHNYLFVNRRGLKVADKTVFGLAAELRRETARIVKDVPLFDRALGAIVKKLSSKSDSS